jgi:hypothetical protein
MKANYLLLEKTARVYYNFYLLFLPFADKNHLYGHTIL